MHSPPVEHDDIPLLEQAAYWFDRVSGGEISEADHRLFETWRLDNAAHATAYAEIEAAHASAKAVSESNEILALRHETLSRLVVRQSARRWRVAMAACIAAVLVASASLLLWRNSSEVVEPTPAVAHRTPDLYQTAIGERLTATLPDGSRIVLNTDSRVRLAYGRNERRLVLERGQALFEVAHGQPRPFVVLAAGQRITAQGTIFDVRIGRDNQVRIALIEGRVTVVAARGQAQPTAMHPNEILIASATSVSLAREPEIEREISWRNGLLIFEDDSLAEAVTEMNRYVRRPIVLADEPLRDLRISGAFRTGETDAFIEALQLSFPVRVSDRRNDAIVLATRSRH